MKSTHCYAYFIKQFMVLIYQVHKRKNITFEAQKAMGKQVRKQI